MSTTQKKSLYLSIATLAVSLICNPAHADYNNQDQSDNSSYQSSNEKSGMRNSTVSDQDISNKIKSKIGSGWFSKGYENVSAQVNNGNVILQGSVKTFDDKNKVEKEVRNIEGVRNLSSQLKVEDQTSKNNQKQQFPQDTFATSADDQLNKKIRDNVSKGLLWDSYKDVSLNTSNGVVTLEGPVDSLKDQQKLVSEVQKVEGVKTVKSNLAIHQ